MIENKNSKKKHECVYKVFGIDIVLKNAATVPFQLTCQ